MRGAAGPVVLPRRPQAPAAGRRAQRGRQHLRLDARHAAARRAAGAGARGGAMAPDGARPDRAAVPGRRALARLGGRGARRYRRPEPGHAAERYTARRPGSYRLPLRADPPATRRRGGLEPSSWPRAARCWARRPGWASWPTCWDRRGVASGEREAASRGAALLALEALGLRRTSTPSIPPSARPISPDPARHARYQDAIARQTGSTTCSSGATLRSDIGLRIRIDVFAQSTLHCEPSTCVVR